MKTKHETYALLGQISLYYEQFEVTQEKIDSWHEALIDFSYESLHSNLLTFVTHSSFPPKICHLTSTSDQPSRAVPDMVETDTSSTTTISQQIKK
ncbi:hypothetical protein [Bacillus sp. MRMR6]|uniref:hypothetical protein n=1 Tax=Bacillus sp. MRMR6 TaxID=1928617 RepID=UPI0009525CBC|nr:hypothetical protein [Bacillus sp. MRMR6]OLS33395.1 hypothetical protein BTR25_26090 [Bacillus sp. MRMR6]